jgi:transaldolase
VKPTQILHEHGQSLWLDNITRTMLDDGTLDRYIDELSITGLTSNPTIFDHAISEGHAYDDQIAALKDAGATAEDAFFELAIDDLRRAAAMFEPIYERTDRLDGYVSLEVSPLLADDAEGTIAQAAELHARAATKNLLIKIPGTEAGLVAIEETIYAGIPVNVTLLFSREHYVAASEAYMRGIQRRIAAGLNPSVRSVASVFISRWDKAVIDRTPLELHGKLAIAIAQRTYKAYREMLDSDHWQRLWNDGARPQRLLWASTGTKDPDASDVLYIEALAAPYTINTMPEPTLLAFGEHGTVGDPVPADGGDCEAVIARFAELGIDVGELATTLQDEGAKSFVDSWSQLMDTIAREAQAA